jgi:hypothetical protein
VQASNLQATGDEATDSSAAAALGHCCVRGCLICDKKRVPHLHLPHVHISLHAFTPHMRDIMSKDDKEVKKSAHLVRGMNQRVHLVKAACTHWHEQDEQWRCACSAGGL